MQPVYTNQAEVVIAEGFNSDPDSKDKTSEDFDSGNSVSEGVITEGGSAPRQATSKEVISRLVPTKTSIAFNMMNLRG